MYPMPTAAAATPGRALAGALDAVTLTAALRITASRYPELVAVRTLGDSVSITWGELLGRVDAVAGGLSKLGVGRGDTVAIMVGNRPEFHIADLAVAIRSPTPDGAVGLQSASVIVTRGNLRNLRLLCQRRARGHK